MAIDFLSLEKELETYVPGIEVKVFDLERGDPMAHGEYLPSSPPLRVVGLERTYVLERQPGLIKIWLPKWATKGDALAILAHEYAHAKEYGLKEFEAWDRGAKYAREWGVMEEYRRHAEEICDYWESEGIYPRRTSKIRKWLRTVT